MSKIFDVIIVFISSSTSRMSGLSLQQLTGDDGDEQGDHVTH